MKRHYEFPTLDGGVSLILSESDEPLTMEVTLKISGCDGEELTTTTIIDRNTWMEMLDVGGRYGSACPFDWKEQSKGSS